MSLERLQTLRLDTDLAGLEMADEGKRFAGLATRHADGTAPRVRAVLTPRSDEGRAAPVAPAAPAAPVAPVAPAAPAKASPIPKDVLPSRGPAVPPVPAAHVTEASDPEPEEVAKGSVKAKNMWATLKGEKKQLQERLAQAEQKLQSVEAQQKPPEMQELLDLRAKLQTAWGRLSKPY
jgi:hypothetical protein